MPKLSNKAALMPASPIRKLVPYAEAAKARGVKVYHLNIGQPDIETPEVAWDALKHIQNKVLEYSHSAGNLSYRKKMVDYYNHVGHDIKVEDVMITTGGSEAILFAMMCCLNEGDEIIIPEPFYANYNGFAVTASVQIKTVQAKIETGFALPAISEIEKQIGPKTKAILICNPNNPTGYLYTKEELTQLAAVVKKHNLFLFADEVYREFVYDSKEHYSVLNFDDIADNVVVVDSISKRYSACGARVGFMVSRNQELMQASLKFAQARLSPPSLGQIVGEASLESGRDYFITVNAEYTKRRNCLVNGLNQIEGVFCPNPGGAFYVVARLPIDNSDKFCQWMLEKFSYEHATVMMAPATGFYATKGLGVNEVRLAYVLKESDLEAAIGCLQEGLKAYRKEMNL